MVNGGSAHRCQARIEPGRAKGQYAPDVGKSRNADGPGAHDMHLVVSAEFVCPSFQLRYRLAQQFTGPGRGVKRLAVGRGTRMTRKTP